MKKTILALIAACIGCCSIPLIFPALAGVGVLGFSIFRSGVTLDSFICGMAFAGLAFIGVYLLLRFMRKSKPKAISNADGTCKTDGSCGCQ